MKELLYIGAAYIRVSDERQDEYSPDSQLKKIREAAAKDGYIIPDEYVFYDDGISGKSVKKRDDFKRMVAMAKESPKPFDRIYVWKFSRFARNQEEAIVYKSLLAREGVSVVSVSEPLPDGAFGQLIERILEWEDQYYLTRLSEEVTRGMTEKASRGEPTCPPPYGYYMKEGKWYPDENAAPVIREIFTRYAGGEGVRQIVTSFHDRGIRMRNGGTIDNRRVDYILHNPAYIGYIRWSPDGSRSVAKRHYDNENIMTVKGHHDPIISEELWETVQKRLAETKRAYPKYAKKEQTVSYMLKGMVRCSSCGATLAASGISGKAKVRCIQCCQYQRGSCGTSHSVTIPKIEAAFIEGLEQAIGNKEFTIIPKATPQAKDEVDYDKLILLEERRLERAKEAYLAEVDTIEQYKQNKTEIEERIASLKAKRDTQPTEVINPEAFSEKVLSIVDFIKRDDVSPTAKNEALRAIIEKVIYDKPNENLAIYFHAV